MTLINRVLQIGNFVGVLALTGMSVLQWSANDRAVATADALRRVRAEQAAKLDEQARTLQFDTSQLDDLHGRLSQAEAGAKDAAATASAATGERDALASQRDALRRTLAQWQAAVAQRDDTIRHAGDEIRTLAAARDDAIRHGNELVSEANRRVASDANPH